MTPFDPINGSQAVYNFWLGLIPQFLGQFGGADLGGAATQGTAENPAAAANTGVGTAGASPLLGALTFPADQIAKAAAMTQQSLQAMAQSIAPMIQGGGVPDLLGRWMTALPPFASGNPGDAAAAIPPSVFPLEAMSQAWMEMGSKIAGATPAQLNTAFDRTYGAVGDALGFAPLRELHVAWQDVVAASIAQQEARTNYALLVQSAMAQGMRRLMRRLAEKAAAGERIDSILALMRLWAIDTEEVVHETLQTEHGLAATAALTRSALTYRKKMQRVAAIIAELLDMATRRELDDAYREIQVLKRELRALRPSRDSQVEKKNRAVPRKRATPRKPTATHR